MSCPSVAFFSPASPGSCHHQYPRTTNVSSLMPFSSSSRFDFLHPASWSTRSYPPVISLAMDVPDYLPVQWSKTQKDKPLGPRFDMSAEEAIECQLQALRNNDQPHADYGVEVMYRFAGFDPFQRSTYFGPQFDLGQFERFRRIFHHSTYRVLLGHKEARVLSSLLVNEHCFKQRVWVKGSRPDEEETFEFTLLQPRGSLLLDWRSCGQGRLPAWCRRIASFEPWITLIKGN